MYSSVLIASAMAGSLVVGTPLVSTTRSMNIPQLNTTGFMDPQITYSQGGHAVCVSGNISVMASTNNNYQLNVSSNLTTTQTIQLILGIDTPNSTYLDQIIGEKTIQGGRYNISSRLCFPWNGSSVQLNISSQVQLLTHGIGFDESYWDFPSPESGSASNQSHSNSGRYSYIDVAAQQGKITFSYDRLGIANSSHPDPVQVVQGPLQVEILHALVGLLRGGQIGNTSFETVIGVGHSFGSTLTVGVTREHPNDFDAIVLTGFSSNATGSPQFTAGLNFQPAASIDQRFADLPAGYLIPGTRYGVQYAFFTYPDFEDSVLSEAFNTAQTTTVGEQVTNRFVAGVAANFTRPVFVLEGAHDLIFCDANCEEVNADGQNFPVATIAKFYPVADAEKSGTYLLDGAGHGVNLAANAMAAFEEIQQWIAGL